MKKKRIKLSETQMAKLVEMNASERIRLNNKGKSDPGIPMKPVKETEHKRKKHPSTRKRTMPGDSTPPQTEATTTTGAFPGRTRVKETSHIENNTRKGGNKTGAKRFKKTNDRVRAMQEQKKSRGGDPNSAIKWLADYKRKNSGKKRVKELSTKKLQESIRKALLKEESECDPNLNLGAGGANAGCPDTGGPGVYGTCVKDPTHQSWDDVCVPIMSTGPGGGTPVQPGGSVAQMNTNKGDGIGGVNTNPQLKKRMRKMSRTPKGQVKGSMNRSQTDKMRRRPYKSKFNRKGL